MQYDSSKSPDSSKPTGIVSLDVPARDLGTFLASLLGERRTLEKRFDCTFEVDSEWIINAFRLIEQRVAAQNEAQLVKLNVETLFVSGKKVRLSGKDQFIAYTDVSMDISTSCRFTCTYLIKYPYRAAPETQEVSFFVQAVPQQALKVGSMGQIRRLMVPLSTDDNVMELRIEHTDISWAEDIHSLIANYVHARFPRRSLWIERSRVIFITFLPLIAGFAGFLVLFYYERGSAGNRLELLKSYADLFTEGALDLPQANIKINALYNYFVLMESSKTSIIPVVFMLSPILALALGLALSRFTVRSYVVMNEATKRQVMRVKRRRRLFFSVVVVGLVLSVVAGVFGNAIYARLPSLY